MLAHTNSNVGTMLGQRRRRWSNIVPTLYGYLEKDNVFILNCVVDYFSLGELFMLYTVCWEAWGISNFSCRLEWYAFVMLVYRSSTFSPSITLQSTIAHHKMESVNMCEGNNCFFLSHSIRIQPLSGGNASIVRTTVWGTVPFSSWHFLLFTAHTTQRGGESD